LVQEMVTIGEVH